jgi:PAS domain S-box-containing protein
MPESRRRKAARTRLESEQQLHVLVDTVTDYAIYMLDPEGRITTWSIGAQRIKGYSAEEIIGQHFSRFYTEEDRRAGHPALALESAQREGRYEAEGWRMRRDGSRFWVNAVV